MLKNKKKTDKNKKHNQKKKSKVRATLLFAQPNPVPKGGSPMAARPRRIRAFGIDPGSVNMGLAEYDATRRRFLSLERVQFRASAPRGSRTADTGQARLIKSVADWVSDNLDRFHDSLIFIENQPPKAYGEEGQAVQHAFQTLFQDRCIPVNAASMKAHFAEHFPRHPKYATFKTRERAVENQKAYDRKNAILAGRKLIPKAVCDDYESKNPGKKDDAFEAAFYALFGAERMMHGDGSLRETPLPPRRRKRSEVHPRGRPSAASASAAPKKTPKRASAPKRVSVPKRASAPKRKRPASSSSDDSTDATDSYLTDAEDPVIDLTKQRPTKRLRRGDKTEEE